VRRRVLLGTVAAFATVAACGDTPEDGGAGATEAMVLETCAPGADPVETEVCQCAFSELQARFDAEELERLDRELLDDPDTVPPEVQEVVLACGFERVAPPTTKPPTATTSAPRPTTSSSSSSTSTTTRRP
jgi:hypothetical protein